MIPGNVLILTAEDGLGDTVRPRLDKMGADISRVYAIQGPLALDPEGIEKLEKQIAEVKPLLVIIDPIQAYASGIDFHKANEVRSILAVLAALAAQYGCAILIVCHLTKGARDKAIYRGIGSIEREIIGERTRDKMAAARQKGKWLGGHTPLGYDVPPGGKRLVVNESEKRIVLDIFDLYIKTRSIMEVVRELNNQGLVTKKKTTKAGHEMGGVPYQVTTIQHILSNILYTGKVPHEGQLYPGEHEGIVPEETFKAAEEIRRENQRCHTGQRCKDPHAFLRGVLKCRACNGSMIPSYTEKDGRRYRYYVCVQAQKRGYGTCSRPSVNAQAMEDAATSCLRRLATDPGASPLGEMKPFFETTWETLFPPAKARVFRLLVSRVEHDGRTGALKLFLNERGILRFSEELSPKEAVA